MTTDTLSLDDIVTEFERDSDPGDPWGCAMIAGFSVANEAFYRTLPIPYSWGYRPGLMADNDPRWRDEDGQLADPLAELLPQLDDYDLMEFGEYLHALLDHLIVEGKDY